MYFNNLIGKLKYKFTYNNLRINIRLKYLKYYQYLEYARRDRRWLLMFMMARFPLGRTIGTSLHHDRLSSGEDSLEVKGNEHSDSMFKDLDIDRIVNSIKQNGYYLGIKLPQSILQEILEFAYSSQMCVDENWQLKFKYAEKKQAEIEYNQKILIGNYGNIGSKCSALRQLENDSILKAIARKYLENEPVLIRSQMWWCFTGEKAAYAQKGEIGNPLVLFHYDLDDYRALKFFFYLTDVDSSSGSHRCVSGSHKRRKLIHYILRSQSDREIADYYGTENIINICDLAGTGFAEDPFCFHRGSPPVTSPRLMIQLEFALNDYRVWNR